MRRQRTNDEVARVADAPRFRPDPVQRSGDRPLSPSFAYRIARHCCRPTLVSRSEVVSRPVATLEMPLTKGLALRVAKNASRDTTRHSTKLSGPFLAEDIKARVRVDQRRVSSSRGSIAPSVASPRRVATLETPSSKQLTHGVAKNAQRDTTLHASFFRHIRSADITTFPISSAASVPHG